MAADKVNVTVQYVGKDDYSDKAPAAQELQAVKVHAMKAFDLNAGDASRYVLQFNGSDLNEHTKLGAFGEVVVLTLALVEEVAKG